MVGVIPKEGLQSAWLASAKPFFVLIRQQQRSQSLFLCYAAQVVQGDGNMILGKGGILQLST